VRRKANGKERGEAEKKGVERRKPERNEGKEGLMGWSGGSIESVLSGRRHKEWQEEKYGKCIELRKA
jgi:hypothetical protein